MAMCLRPTMRKLAKGPMPLRSAMSVSVGEVRRNGLRCC
jgi:hypothetical protein